MRPKHQKTLRSKKGMGTKVTEEDEFRFNQTKVVRLPQDIAVNCCHRELFCTLANQLTELIKVAVRMKKIIFILTMSQL